MSHSACFLLVTGVTQIMNLKAEKIEHFFISTSKHMDRKKNPPFP